MSLPRMYLHIGDYRKDTGHLRAAGHGAYLLLIMHYWATGSLPDDDEQLAAITCMSDDEWRKWRPIIQKFFAPGWKHKRVEAELEEAREKYERRAAAGRKGGRPSIREKPQESKASSPPKQPITDNQEEGRGGGDARATPLISQLASETAEKIAKIAGFAAPADWPPGWCGAPMRMQAMLAHGWKPEIMIVAAQEAMGRKRDGPPDTINYFEKPFARAHARQAAPLPTVIISDQPQVIHETTGTGAYPNSGERQGRGFASIAIDRARASGAT